MLDATAIREFLCRSIWERDALHSALVVDARSPELQQEIAAWHKGSLTGLFPSGETRRLLDEFRPVSGAGECRQAYQRANADVLRANLGVHLCPKLEALMVAHNTILDEASKACEQSSTQLANLESHCQAATDLIDIIQFYVADTPEGDTAKKAKPVKRKTAKRTRINNDSERKLIAALTLHHKYSEDSCLNFKPVRNIVLASSADVGKASASRFFKSKFGGHAHYVAMCRSRSDLIASLKLLNNEYTPRMLNNTAELSKDRRREE